MQPLALLLQQLRVLLRVLLLVLLLVVRLQPLVPLQEDQGTGTSLQSI